ncbi:MULTISPECIES: aminodeoxychorismate lyase [Aliivibrio]|uniref:Aminodeoxychorismate lyase n=1 Tax=Aliivibrio logei TaxID=688 RepID=A0A1B9P1T7_ALILO|nr:MULTISPECIES: aminodeoxychorismate lyase [Aliivibrio]MBB1314281.1 aminodeoxychorismate lyase [Aliivibrio sp. SR45-2]OCH22324.1 aminodeoxychorismate lyase [Aliivibrio logei]
MYWVNGVVTDSLPLTDRSIQYGDGSFTTMKVERGRVRLWDLHLARLKEASKRLDIKIEDWLLLETQIESCAHELQDGGIKILISRGSGGRGYSPEGCHDTQIIVSTFSYPTYYQNWKEGGISLMLCETQLGLSPLLAGMKHTNRLEQVLIKKEIAKTMYLDGVVLDLNNKVIETSIGNIFWVKGDNIYTPNLSNSGVEGVMKAHIYALANLHGLTLFETSIYVDELCMADEVFISNSLFEIVPINAIGNTTFDSHKLSHWFQEKLYSC